MSKRMALVAALLVATVAAHTPVLGAEPDKPKEPKSKLITDEELQAALPQVLPGCTRAALVRGKTSEMLVGFAADSNKPVALATVARYTDKKRKGTMAVVVGMKDAGKKLAITRVVTLPAKGKVKGREKFEKGRKKFLKQFDGRVVKARLGKVHAVTGATPLCKGIRSTVDRSLKTLRAMRAQPAELKKLAAKSWPIEQPALKTEKDDDDEDHGDDDDEGRDDGDRDDDDDDDDHHHDKDDDEKDDSD